MVQGVLGHPATVSEWEEMVSRSGCGGGEDLTWAC
jgi:hypothetical protein